MMPPNWGNPQQMQNVQQPMAGFPAPGGQPQQMVNPQFAPHNMSIQPVPTAGLPGGVQPHQMGIQPVNRFAPGVSPQMQQMAAMLQR